MLDLYPRSSPQNAGSLLYLASHPKSYQSGEMHEQLELNVCF